MPRSQSLLKTYFALALPPRRRGGASLIAFPVSDWEREKRENIEIYTGIIVTELALHNHLSHLPEEALQEFTEWCVLEQAKEAGYKLTPDKTKLNNLLTGDYIHQLVDQFMKVKPDPIRTGLAGAIAGKQADKHALSGTAAIVDFVSLYIRYLIPKEGSDPEQADKILTQASQQQFEKLSEIAKKYDVEISS